MTATHPLAERPKRPVPVGIIVTTVVVAALGLWAFLALDVKWSRLADVPQRTWDVIRLMAEQLSWDDLGTCLEAMWDSIAIAWLGTLVAAVFAIPLAFVAAENLVPHWVALIVRQVLNILRAIPEIILVLALLPMLGFSPSAGILAVGIGSIGTLGKLCSDVLEGIDRGPVEAVDAAGASTLQRLRWGVLPQSAPEIASFVLYRFEINIRVSTILGAVGAGGIGQVVNDAFRVAIPKDFGLAGMALIVMVVITIAVDAISGRVRRRLLAGPGGRPEDLTGEQKATALTGTFQAVITGSDALPPPDVGGLTR
jgi:phosphonate transport system permease protein